LRQGRVQPVLRRLSGTWTSLGYGIETNSMSRQLPRIYQQVLKEELARAGTADKRPGTAQPKAHPAKKDRI
jgi:muramidase (phage lysozyme)